MKAAVRTRYGSPDVLHLSEVPTPSPEPDEVLVRVFAASVNGSDKEGLVGSPLYVRMGGLRAPREHVLGSDVSGRVEQVGNAVREFRPGDDVLGERPGYFGGFAEFACIPEKLLIRKPASLTFAQAAAIPQAGAIAFRGICSKGKVQPNWKVLINGAGGGGGTFAVQLAKLSGAEVTAVDSAEKQEFLRTLGADHVIDFARQDFTNGAERYDLILDLIASRSVFAYARVLKPGGRYYCVGGAVSVLLQTLLLGPWIQATRGKHIRVLVVPQNRADVVSILDLCVAGKVRPVIDAVYPFDRIADALRQVVEGRHKGKVVIAIGEPTTEAWT
jgi:NADPH:quinone reductase-like Zn-dependent oxidoreductase